VALLNCLLSEEVTETHFDISCHATEALALSCLQRGLW